MCAGKYAPRYMYIYIQHIKSLCSLIFGGRRTVQLDYRIKQLFCAVYALQKGVYTLYIVKQGSGGVRVYWFYYFIYIVCKVVLVLSRYLNCDIRYLPCYIRFIGKSSLILSTTVVDLRISILSVIFIVGCNDNTGIVHLYINLFYILYIYRQFVFVFPGFNRKCSLVCGVPLL